MIDRWFKRRQRDRSGSSLPVEERTHVPSPPSDPAPSRHAEEGHDGRIWVDAVGKIQVRNPRSRHGHYPVMVVPDSDWLSVSVNRSPVIGERVVEQNSRIQVRLLVQAPQSQVTVTIAPDGMEATLHVSYVSGERRALMPTKPSTRLVLEARRIAIEPPPVTLAQVRTELSRAGITAGLVPHAAIESFLARHESGSLVVARGVPPYPGGGTLESFRPDGLEGPWVVDTGTTIGRRRPDPARPGRSVRGEVLPAPMIWPDREVHLGPGVTVMTHATDLVANRSGVVVFDAHIVDVVGQHEMSAVEAGADILVIDGDLVVHGDVQDRTIVVAGNLTVEGDIRGADVVVGGALAALGATVDSRVTLGLARYVRERVHYHTARIVDGLYDLELTVNDLGDLGERLGAVVARVVSEKFFDVMESLSWIKTASCWPGLRWSGPLVNLASAIYQHLQSGEELVHILSHLWSLRTELDMCEPVIEETPMGRTLQLTRFHQVENSFLDGTGTLTVDKAQSSRLTAGTVVVTGSVVGGLISAAERVQCEILGDVEGTETRVEVNSDDGQVEASSAYPGVLVVIGGLRHTLRTPRQTLRLTRGTLQGGDSV